MNKITLIPIGAIEPEILSRLKQSVAQTFDSQVEIGPQMEEPNYAYDSKRRQYLASAILEAIQKPEKGERGTMLGIVDVDLYAPGLNFVFGQADIEQKVAVISLCRLRQEFYRLPRDEALFMERAIKEAVHELGHTYGLGHCRDEFCVMHFSNSLADTDRKHVSLCQKCWSKLWKEL